MKSRAVVTEKTIQQAGWCILRLRGSPRLGRLLPLPLPPSSALNSEQV